MSDHKQRLSAPTAPSHREEEDREQIPQLVALAQRSRCSACPFSVRQEMVQLRTCHSGLFPSPGGDIATAGWPLSTVLQWKSELGGQEGLSPGIRQRVASLSRASISTFKSMRTPALGPWD